jgi:dihydroorotase
VWDGHARTVGSDHAPHELADKFAAPADAPPGLPGVQELVPALFTGLRLRYPYAEVGTLLMVLSRVLGSAPARLFRLNRCKGRIATGLDADLVLFDPDARWSLAEQAVHSKCGWSAYQGRSFIGRVEQTIRRGEVIFDNGSFGKPSGKFVGAGAAL